MDRSDDNADSVPIDGDNERRERVSGIGASNGWILDIIHGTLLAGLLVGVWEWDGLVLKDRWPFVDSYVLAFGGPTTLLVVVLWGHMMVPFGVFVISLVSMWYLLASWRWSLIGSLAVWAATAVTSLTVHGYSSHMVFDVSIMLGFLLGLAITSHRVANFRRMMALYGGAVVVAATAMILNRDGVHDIVVSLTAAALAGGYLVGRARRESRWAKDIERAEHDPLTGALTRYGLGSWQRKFAGKDVLGLIVACDLDDFKSFNDTWGHHLGDEVLKMFTDRLRTACRQDDAIVRTGGDEFVVWMPGLMEETSAQVVAEKLHQAVIGLPYDVSIGSVRLGVSMGWALGILGEETAKRADRRLLVAKRRGKNRVIAKEPNHAPRDSGNRNPELSTAELGWLGDAARVLWKDWPVAALLTNRNGRIVAANDAYQKLTGRTWSELSDRKPSINSAGTTPPKTYEDLWHTLDQGLPWEGTLQNQRPNGDRWWAHEQIVPVRIGSQVVGYWAAIEEQLDTSSKTGNEMMSET